jgi:hypothetical protein
MEIIIEIINLLLVNFLGWYAKKIKDLLILSADLANAMLLQLDMFYFNLYKFH